MNRCNWSELAAFVLEPALDGADIKEFEREVNEGVCDLWYRDHAYSVTQLTDDAFHIWLVAGKDLIEFVSEMVRYAIRAGCKKMTFRTQHPGVVKMTERVCDRFSLSYPEYTEPKLCEYTVWLRH